MTALSNVSFITEKQPKTVGARIVGFGKTQTVELRYHPEDVTMDFPQDLMIMVNDRDTDVAYIRVSDLLQALTGLGIPQETTRANSR